MNPIDLNDPRLTLYALGEMEPRELAEFEQLLEQDAAARRAVEEIRATVATVTAALAEEPVEAPQPAKRGVLLRFPQFYYTVSGLAAACFALFFIYGQRNPVGTDHQQYIEVPLTQAPADDEAKNADSNAVAEFSRRDAQEKREGLVAAAKEEYRLKKDHAQNQVAVALPVAPAAASAPAEMMAMDKIQVAGDSATGVGAGLRDNRSGVARVAAKTKAMPATAPAASVRMEETVQPTPFSVAAEQSWGSAGGKSVTGGMMQAERQASTEAYGYSKDNDYRRVADQPLSTFSIDVDTASYANVRRFLRQGRRPPVDAVRIEELVNYFPYHYTPPTGEAPFAASLEVASAPWNPKHRLVRIGLKGREVPDAQRPAANLVFLLDVSGSMNQPNKLPLVKQSLRLLVEKLRPDDRVAIAVYAGASGLALPSTSAARQAEILDAIDRLEAAGSTNGAMGIQLAYDLAKANFIPGGVNRVILATDGDFNVGVTSEGELVRLVQEKAKSGVFLSVLGFGIGNLQDRTLEQLADKGNGNYAYIDSLAEARKALIEQAGGTLLTIAKDVKIQVEFNPLEVVAYRLIGYENRLLAKEDFNNDQVDAGEIGAGHTVTALYEVVLTGALPPGETPAVDALKYQQPAHPLLLNHSELLTVKIRYKEPAGDVSRKLEFPLRDSGAAFASASPDFKFAAAVAAFGMVLRDSPHQGGATLTDVAAWGREGITDDVGGYRAEFISLVEHAATLQ